MQYDSIPTHPVPPRLLDGPEVSYIGPNIEAYRKAYAETVGENADKWWAKVSLRQCFRRRQLFTTIVVLKITDGDGVAALGHPLPDRQVWQLRERRHCLVPRRVPQRFLQLC